MTSQLFTPLTIRGVEFRNRAWVSPMCQYSAVDGVSGQWHQVHLGSFATGGTGLIMVEATGVNPEGRISVACLGIWNQEQADALKPIIDFAHSMGTKVGIQLAHAGRKGSTTAPGSDHPNATAEEGGWQIVAPSAIAFPGYPEPHALTKEEILQVVRDFVSAALRSLEVGFDVLEIHGAHGYLIHEFLSPLSNTRTDEYGGDFTGRTRLLREIVSAIRSAIPDSVPLFLRISATDWVDGGWDLEQSIELMKILKEAGVDLVDVSTGGNVAGVKIPVGPGYQVPMATAIKEQTGILTSTVGLITDPVQAEEILSSGQADAISLGRAFLRNPRWPLFAAETLGDVIEWPKQLERARTVH
ncbi:MAG: NADH:flavin oxidoreductase/NADH oxidase [Actinomycetes bacterium]